MILTEREAVILVQLILCIDGDQICSVHRYLQHLFKSIEMIWSVCSCSWNVIISMDQVDPMHRCLSSVLNMSIQWSSPWIRSIQCTDAYHLSWTCLSNDHRHWEDRANVQLLISSLAVIIASSEINKVLNKKSCWPILLLSLELAAVETPAFL